jgi:hypothetical protein
MQRPILRDGVVVNVIELDDDTEIVTKARHKELCVAEDADYAAKLAAWRGQVTDIQKAFAEAVERLDMARATASALKVRAEDLQDGPQAGQVLKQILAVEKQIASHEASAAAQQAKTVPARPRLVRGKRWFHPEGLEAGPAGGNIGDLWDGKTYTRPEKTITEAA